MFPTGLTKMVSPSRVSPAAPTQAPVYGLLRSIGAPTLSNKPQFTGG